MPEFIVHSIPGSPYGRAVLAALEEKRAAYRLAPVVPGTTKLLPHLSRHPFGRIPAVEHDGFMLYETQAILRYIDRVAPGPALTVRAAARMDQVMNINDWYLFQGVGNVIAFHRVVAPRLMGLAPDEAACAAALPKAETVFAELSRLLGDQAYLAGAAVSLADLMVGPQMDMLSAAPEWAALTANRPNLQAWLARLQERPSFVATTWERVAQMAKAN